ncbi:hypothetical protein H4J56_05305 [Colwellia sp. BRX8-4]|uniref:iron-containing redox enzyme family protein n=1 Tax=Colwellia sp. BRX8-4 TaxID=2759836 RepID=UPI0015F735C2|nr:iron-containing redox enzyme family protein [Colwellia sp. BRX8-4]MBA6365037.1 hypothetical protein [Colwellia sp. BRX8-8]MBA6370842.1 hypothetical protein [Colwellia sp. BRX8-4]
MEKKNTLTHYQRLNTNLLLMKMRAGAVNSTFTQLACYPDVCIEQAIVNYKISTTSTELMKEVIRCAKLRPEDPISKPLIAYMEQHIPEELNHDEWCLQDLEVLGVPRVSVINKIPSTNLAALIGSQYYWIRHADPIAFMGYLACLEVNHPTVEYVETLIETSGLPAAGFNSLMHHAKVDSHHKQDIIDTINALPLTQEQYKLMELSAFQTYRYVALVMEDVCRVAPVQQKTST